MRVRLFTPAGGDPSITRTDDSPRPLARELSSESFATIQQRANRSPHPLAEYLWIHDRVATWPHPKLSGCVAQELLPLLLASNRNREALRIAKSQLRAHEYFRPLASESLLRLAQLARDAGDRPLARALLSDFDRHFPEDPMANRAQRLAAELAR